MPPGTQHLQIALHFPLTALGERHLASRLDLWLDDDVQGQSPAQVAAKTLKAFCTLQDDLQIRALPVSTVKTKIVASNGLTADQSRRQAQEGDPQVTDLARDLGVDSSCARKRRLNTFRQRNAKAEGRVKRLNVLRPQSKGPLRMVKGSIMPAGTYGQACRPDR